MQYNIYNTKTYVKQCMKIPKRAITNRECQKDRQYNGQKTDNTMAKRKRTNSDLQNTTQIIAKDQAMQTPQKRGWTQVLRKG